MASYPALEIRFTPGAGVDALQDQLYGALDDHEPLAIHEQESGDGWLVFFRTPAHRDAARESLLASLDRPPASLRSREIEDDNWARRSQENLRAVTVGRLVVAPPWDLPASPAAHRQVVVIEPSMGFGTGHHATTRLCLALLQACDLRGVRVIDVGTGSGVLAIAARLLGAREVVALDYDPDALVNARENVARNPDAAPIDVRQADLAALSLPAAQVVTANLTAAVLITHAEALLRLAAPGATLIVSGFSPAERDAVSGALGGHVLQEAEEDGWTALALTAVANRD